MDPQAPVSCYQGAFQCFLFAFRLLLLGFLDIQIQSMMQLQLCSPCPTMPSWEFPNKAESPEYLSFETIFP